MAQRMSKEKQGTARSPKGSEGVRLENIPLNLEGRPYTLTTPQRNPEKGTLRQSRRGTNGVEFRRQDGGALFEATRSCHIARKGRDLIVTSSSGKRLRVTGAFSS